MVAIRVLLISVVAGLAGAFGGELFTRGSVPHFGPTMFASYFTLLGALGILAPGYAFLKSADVPLSRRYFGVILLGTLAGGLILLPMDLATGGFDGVRLGACFGAITAFFWVLLHAVLRAMERKHPVA